MSLANLEYDNFFALHNALKMVKDLELDVWVTIEMDKDENGAYILPSSDAHILSLYENINDLLDICEEIDVVHLLFNYSIFSVRLKKLFEKVESIEQQHCNIFRFGTIETAWFDFGILVNTIHSILLEELNEGSYECGEGLQEYPSISKHINYLLWHSAEMMNISTISKFKIKGKSKTIH